jgi:MFS family permease
LLQLVYGYSPLGAALRMAPISIAIVIAAPRSAKLAARYGKRRVVAAGMWLIAAGILIMSTISLEANYPLLLTGLMVMAFGMGIAMSPTTDLLMSAVPRAQAGMGSAMNDTTRELGGSLGVAVFGSLLASQYATSITPTVAALPAQAQDVASNSLAGALAVSSRLGEHGQAFATAARDAWLSGFRFSLVIGAIVVTAAGFVAFRFLPDQAADLAIDVDNDDHDLVDAPVIDLGAEVTVASAS